MVFLFEQHHQAWAKDLHELFLEMLESVRALKARDAPPTQGQYRRWQKQYRRILRAGRKANPLTPQQRAMKRGKQSKAQNLLDRLEGYEEAILAFLWALELPFTNAFAERFVRTIKASCLERMIFFGESALRRAVSEFSLHYHTERVSGGMKVGQRWRFEIPFSSAGFSSRASL